MSDPQPSAGRIEQGAHLLPLRVYWEDTDAAGIVYYANYLRFIERGRSDFLRLLGLGQESLRQSGVLFPVRSCNIDYVLPARLDDPLLIRTRIADIKGASIDMHQTVMRSGSAKVPETLANAVIRLACIDATGRPRRIPAEVREVFQPHLATLSPNLSTITLNKKKPARAS